MIRTWEIEADTYSCLSPCQLIGTSSARRQFLPKKQLSLTPVPSHLSVAFDPVNGILLVFGIRVSTREMVPDRVSLADHMPSLESRLAIDIPGYYTCLPYREI